MTLRPEAMVLASAAVLSPRRNAKKDHAMFEQRISAKSRFISTVAAAAVALAAMTAAAMPAHASSKSDKMLMAILGIGAIALIANGAHRDEKKPKPKPQRPVVVEPYPPLADTLPSVCAMNISGLRGEARGYGESCLTRYGVNDRLPKACAHRTEINGYPDRIYAENCMLRAGYRLGR